MFPALLTFRMMDSVAQVEPLNIYIRWGVKNGFSSDNHKKCLVAQSFTSLKADLFTTIYNQDISGGFAFSKCLNGTFP